MTKKIISMLLLSICGVVFMTTALTAEESTEVTKRNVAAGARAEPFDKQMVRLKSREEQVAKDQKSQSKGRKEKSSKKKHAEPAQVPQAAKSMKAAPMPAAAFAKKIRYTTHPGAYQHPVSVSYLGDSIELMDGSIWSVSPSEAHKTINWFPSDLVVVSPNSTWFSPYSFRLTNQQTGESAAANLYLGPIDPLYNSTYTHWIIGIDYYYNYVYLEDGSRWSMSSIDSSVIDQWMINDVVIIGINTGFLSSYNPNILINVNMLNYAAGACSF